MDTGYRPKNKIIRLENEECAADGCHRVATRGIVFELGFSARFCYTCSEELLAKKIGIIEETYNDLSHDK